MSSLKKIRKETGLTQKEIAKKLSVSQPAVSQIETDPTYSENFMSYLKILFDNGADLNKIFKKDK